MLNIIITDSDLWETQFLFQDILPKNCNKIFCHNNELVDKKFFKSLKNLDEIIGNNVFVFQSSIFIRFPSIPYISRLPCIPYLNDNYQKIKEILQFLKPKLVINLSDEYGNRPKFQKLAEYTNLILRQHHHPKYKDYENILHIPLGYMNNLMEDNYLDIELKSPKDRKYTWSFIGKLKKDRRTMIDTFKKLNNYLIGTTNSIDMRDMREIYRDSIFVPNGRGNHSLDCFRLYEASICGAIPIVVGDKKEIEETFKYEESPPWIFADDWDHALGQVSRLLNEPELLEQRHKEVVFWWRNRLKTLKNKVDHALKS